MGDAFGRIIFPAFSGFFGPQMTWPAQSESRAWFINPRFRRRDTMLLINNCLKATKKNS